MDNYKGFNIVGDETTMKKIVRDGSGTLPVALSGYFTKVDLARSAIDNYVREQEKPKKPKKVQLNGSSD